MKTPNRLALAVVLALVIASLSLAQSPPKKSYTFHGKVISVDKSAKTLNIDGEKVEGWMAAVTMNYKSMTRQLWTSWVVRS